MTRKETSTFGQPTTFTGTRSGLMLQPACQHCSVPCVVAWNVTRFASDGRLVASTKARQPLNNNLGLGFSSNNSNRLLNNVEFGLGCFVFLCVCHGVCPLVQPDGLSCTPSRTRIPQVEVQRNQGVGFGCDHYGLWLQQWILPPVGGPVTARVEGGSAKRGPPVIVRVI